MTNEELAEFQYLSNMTPAQLDKQEKGERYQQLFAQRLTEEEADHQRTVDEIMRDEDIKTAWSYNYYDCLHEIDQARFTLPHTVTIHALVELLIKVQSWKDFVGELRRACSKHSHVLESAYNRVVSDWQSRSLAHTEWQAKAQATARYSALCAMKDKAKNSQRQCDLMFERLEGQWQTVSRAGAMMDSIVRMGGRPEVPLNP